MNYDFTNSPDIHKYIDTINWIDSSLAELAEDVSNGEYNLPIIVDPSTKWKKNFNLRLFNNDRGEKYLLYYSKGIRVIQVYDKNNKEKYSFFFSSQNKSSYKLIFDMNTKVSLDIPIQDTYLKMDKNNDPLNSPKLLCTLSIPIFPDKDKYIPKQVTYTLSHIKSSNKKIASLGVPSGLCDMNDDSLREYLNSQDYYLFNLLTSTFIHSSIIQNMETIKQHFLKNYYDLDTHNPHSDVSEEEDLSL